MDATVTTTAEPAILVEGVVDCPEEAVAARLRELAAPGWLTDEMASAFDGEGYELDRLGRCQGSTSGPPRPP